MTPTRRLEPSGGLPLAAYLVVAHLALAVLLWIAFRERPFWLLTAEIGLGASAVLAVRLLGRLVKPLRSLRSGAALLSESDYSIRLRPVGVAEIDETIDVFNAMLDRLRQERLKAEEQGFFLREVMQVSPVGVITLDFEGAVETFNPAAASFFPDLGVGRLPHTLEPAELSAPLTLLRPGRSEIFTTPDRRQLRVTAGQLLDRGFPRRFFLIEELTEEIRRAERRAHEQLVRMIAHEVNNSVGAVASLLASAVEELDEAPFDSSASVQRLLQLSRERLRRLDDFIRALAEVVRLPPPTLEPLDLVGLCREVLEAFGPELEARGIEAALQAEERLELDADAAQIERVLANLIRNAAEAIGEGGRIEIRTSMRAEGPRLEVLDDGPGIGPAELPQLFSPFFSTKDRGRGLGLSLVHEILDRHGCRFWFEAAEPRGTRFCCYFPSEGPDSSRAYQASQPK